MTVSYTYVLTYYISYIKLPAEWSGSRLALSEIILTVERISEWDGMGCDISRKDVASWPYSVLLLFFKIPKEGKRYPFSSQIGVVIIFLAMD